MPNRHPRSIAAYLAPLCATAIVAACGGDTTEPVTPEERPASVIGDPLHQAIDRAESVQDTLDERAADLRRRLDEVEGN